METIRIKGEAGASREIGSLPPASLPGSEMWKMNQIFQEKEEVSMRNRIEYMCLPGKFAAANENFLKKCVELYSNHYGVWGQQGIHPNENIKLSVDRICNWLDSDAATIYYAMLGDDVIGYAIAFSIKEYGYGIVTWVTQLVVHKEYRQQGIAKNILFSIWGFSNHYAWGIVSANPYAVRALEKATRRRARPVRIKKNAIKLRNIGRQNVPFINDDTVFQITQDKSVVNTQFFVDHSDTKSMLDNVTKSEVPWELGEIDEGWEWFAFTFNDQEQISLSKEEIDSMIMTSDAVVKQAYSRMELDEKKQVWMRHTSDEIDFILSNVDVFPGDKVYDLGCGTGRHSIELSHRGMNVIGIDYLSKNIDRAKERLEKSEVQNVQFIEDDCRYFESLQKASLVICLYDVVGSFAIEEENEKIIRTAYRLLKSGGFAVFSVMNYESTVANAEHTFQFSKEPDRLLDLEASNTMEETGNVFTSAYYLVDTETHLVYRKEQFYQGAELPVELIVRDKRYTREELISLLQKEGFVVRETKYANASDWNRDYGAEDPKAKEIIAICQKI